MKNVSRNSCFSRTGFSLELPLPQQVFHDARVRGRALPVQADGAICTLDKKFYLVDLSFAYLVIPVMSRRVALARWLIANLQSNPERRVAVAEIQVALFGWHELAKKCI